MSTVAGCELCEQEGGIPVFRNDVLRVIRADDADHPAFYRVIWNAHVAEWSDLSAAERDTMMAAVAAGQFPPMPSDKPCRYCDFRTVCGTAIGRRIPPKRDYDPAIDALFDRLARAPPSARRCIEDAILATAPTAEIGARARAGEPLAVRVLDEYCDRFGRALANVVNILDPDVIVLGGGLSNLEALYRQGRDALARYVFNDELRTPILRPELGDSAGVIGAAMLAAS